MGFCWRSLETAEAPPVADEARWFRGSVPVFTPQRGWKSADTTVCAFAHFSSWWEKWALEARSLQKKSTRRNEKENLQGGNDRLSI